jgi:hypothetical protein
MKLMAEMDFISTLIPEFHLDLRWILASNQVNPMSEMACCQLRLLVSFSKSRMSKFRI